MTDLAAFIDQMPKAELHLHLEGTLEPELKFELAARNGISLPYASAGQMRAGYAFRDLTSFLAAYYEGMSVLRGEQDFYDLAMAYFRTASAQNVVYAEAFFDPQAHTSRGIAFETVIGGLHRAGLDAQAQLGLRDVVRALTGPLSHRPAASRGSGCRSRLSGCPVRGGAGAAATRWFA